MGAFSLREMVMTMQTSGPKNTGFFQRTAVQITVTVVVMIVVILLAWRYVV
jgi:hypothetical protein